jgi:anthranilate synthase component 1
VVREAAGSHALTPVPPSWAAEDRGFRVPLDGWPDLLALHHGHPERYPCLFESVSGGHPRARYDLLLAGNGEHLTLHGSGALERDGGLAAGGFLEALDGWWRTERCPRGRSELPFHGGWLVFLSYELAAEIEPRLRLEAAGELPVATARRCPAAIIRDHAANAAWLVAEEGQAALLDVIQGDLRRIDGGAAADEAPIALRALAEDPPGQFLDGVERARRHIADGDVFQVNLSRAWRGRLASGVDSAAIYRRLRATNPAPFAALARLGNCAVISSSPERLVSVRSGVVETRPIAGTHPRGADTGLDDALARRLLAHPKERAEHVMLIDLERNDLGRVCAPGSVEVNELMALESYAHVHHIVSNVRGRLLAGATPGAVLRAVFPGGTITGCPKVRCMEIIRALEGCARGAYTGALGYLGRDGDMDFNILIRTLVRHGNEFTLRAGAGIVADSVPGRELEETRAKARGLLRVFAGAV